MIKRSKDLVEAMKATILDNGIKLLNNGKEFYFYLLDYLDVDIEQDDLLRIVFLHDLQKLFLESNNLNNSRIEFQEKLINDYYVDSADAKLLSYEFLDAISSCLNEDKDYNDNETQKSSKEVLVGTDQNATLDTASDSHKKAKDEFQDYHDNINYSIEELLKYAESGVAEAQIKLADCYKSGEGVEENPTEAFKWFMKAAELGDERAQCNIGWCYASGFGVQENLYESFRWFKKAADQGHAASQIQVGFCYANGYGVEKKFVRNF